MNYELLLFCSQQNLEYTPNSLIEVVATQAGAKKNIGEGHWS